jgi:hypothetical protein
MINVDACKKLRRIITIQDHKEKKRPRRFNEPRKLQV